jgi:hypothetical protein
VGGSKVLTKKEGIFFPSNGNSGGGGGQTRFLDPQEFFFSPRSLTMNMTLCMYAEISELGLSLAAARCTQSRVQMGYHSIKSIKAI